MSVKGLRPKSLPGTKTLRRASGEPEAEVVNRGSDPRAGAPRRCDRGRVGDRRVKGRGPRATRGLSPPTPHHPQHKGRQDLYPGPGGVRVRLRTEQNVRVDSVRDLLDPPVFVSRLYHSVCALTDPKSRGPGTQTRPCGQGYSEIRRPRSRTDGEDSSLRRNSPLPTHSSDSG